MTRMTKHPLWTLLDQILDGRDDLQTFTKKPHLYDMTMDQQDRDIEAFSLYFHTMDARLAQCEHMIAHLQQTILHLHNGTTP